jgi:hypothetical protein
MPQSALHKAANVVQNLQKERYCMENLTRYSDQSGLGQEMDMLPDSEGEWVKFSDINELLQTSHNISVMPCRYHQVAFYCSQGFFAACRDKPCIMSAARA